MAKSLRLTMEGCRLMRMCRQMILFWERKKVICMLTLWILLGTYHLEVLF